jgi:hypothetical protein
MRAAGYKPITECSAPLKTYESCMKIADEIMRGPSANQYRDADWNRICLDNEWDVQTQKRLSADCYQPAVGDVGWVGEFDKAVPRVMAGNDVADGAVGYLSGNKLDV